MSNVKSEELERFLEILRNEVSAFLKLCPICKQKFKDTLDKRLICTSCERDQKIDSILNK
jgi:protein-arginine kinase activator protein McsA